MACKKGQTLNKTLFSYHRNIYLLLILVVLCMNQVQDEYGMQKRVKHYSADLLPGHRNIDLLLIVVILCIYQVQDESTEVKDRRHEENEANYKTKLPFE